MTGVIPLNNFDITITSFTLTEKKSIAANSTDTLVVNIPTLENYTLIGIVGTRLGNATSGGANSGYCIVQYAYRTTESLNFRIYNTASSAAVIYVTAYLLWRRRK